MDENRHPYSLKAPGPSSGSGMRLPGRGSFPGVDDRLVVPEVTRDEIIGGRRVVASPAAAPHAIRHGDLQYLLRAHVAVGYLAAVDLLTRHAEDSDFASDACVFREGTDPETGSRYLEELAFEVVSEQNERDVREKAPRMHRRGVRRIFALFVKKRQVCEWSAEGGGFRPLAPDAKIEDRCLVTPLAVAALLDAAASDDAVVAALAAKGNRALRQRESSAYSEGKAEGKREAQMQERAEAILKVFTARGLTVRPADRKRVLGCQDLDLLDRWLQRAVVAETVAAVLASA